MSNRLFLHIGYPKTGTTALQRHVFPALRKSGFLYSGVDDPENPLLASTFARMVNIGERSNMPAQELGENTLISAEGILFDCLRQFDDSGRFQPFPITGLAQRTHEAARLHGADETRIIIVLRQQGELSHSLYAQSYTHFFSRDPELHDYRSYASRLIAGDSIGDALDYARVVGDYRHIFGYDRVSVMFYEDLVSEPQDFLTRLAAFLGAQLPDTLPAENVRLVAQNARTTQPLNLLDSLRHIKRRLLPRTCLGIGRYLHFLQHVPVRAGTRVALQPDLEQQVLEHFRECNIQLAEMTGRDLSPLGYY